MLDLTEIVGHVADQDRWTWFDLRDPVDGSPTGIRFLVAGPDSTVQRRAQLRLAEELIEAAGDDGRARPEDRGRAQIACLARCLLGWEIVEGGEQLPFTHVNAVRVLSAARWIEAQVDDFAGRRPPIARKAA